MLASPAKQKSKFIHKQKIPKLHATKKKTVQHHHQRRHQKYKFLSVKGRWSKLWQSVCNLCLQSKCGLSCEKWHCPFWFSWMGGLLSWVSFVQMKHEKTQKFQGKYILQVMETLWCGFRLPSGEQINAILWQGVVISSLLWTILSAFCPVGLRKAHWGVRVCWTGQTKAAQNEMYGVHQSCRK